MEQEIGFKRQLAQTLLEQADKMQKQYNKQQEEFHQMIRNSSNYALWKKLEKPHIISPKVKKPHYQEKKSEKSPEPSSSTPAYNIERFNWTLETHSIAHNLQMMIYDR